ncbi:esterase-like activity of phytase family protein [uncultured Roseobacter sp.]|uniref:esterase-like activity of phytase family protein n=1 Tax=uncultured Roseobacter sp. TaxID=114847 RepID=UPI00261E7B6F|nr:esterase-like activity of phytase family protein [uncultured Roseobacter sp.]
MRKRLAVAAATLGIAALILIFSWWPRASAVPSDGQPARHVSTYVWQDDNDWFGGFSGLELTPDGTAFYAVTDRAYLVRGSITRTDGQITATTIDDHRQLVDRNGNTRRFPHDDAEGLALDGQGRLFVSFEGAQRILRYDDWEANARWPSYTRAWRALHINGGLEAVAVDAAGTLYTLPEGVPRGAYEALVYRRHPQQKWQQPFTLPLDIGYLPVGADFGPDGRLYLLERKLTTLGFRSRIRAMSVTEDGVRDIETVLETPRRIHGNLEGLSVWQDSDGRIRLTMISDNNFWRVLPTHIVEYVLIN